MRILVIEDDADAAAFLTKGLREAGHAVDHVLDGATGLIWPKAAAMMPMSLTVCCLSSTG